MNVVISQAAFEEGKAAKASGKLYTEDPYRAGTQDSADWLAGFTADEPDISMTGNNGDSSGFSVSGTT